MDEFAELGHSFNEMGVGEISDPVSWLGIKGYGREEFTVLRYERFERPVDAYICAAPVVARTHSTVPVFLTDHCELRVKKNAYRSIARELSRPIVECSHNYLVSSRRRRTLRQVCARMICPGSGRMW
jgi:hypothetical protein